MLFSATIILGGKMFGSGQVSCLFTASFSHTSGGYIMKDDLNKLDFRPVQSARPTEELYEMCRDILEHPDFLDLKTRVHHHSSNVYCHLVRAAKAAVIICRHRGYSEEMTREIVRAALLHDFCDFDWRLTKQNKKQWTLAERIHRQYVYHHGKNAAKNAKRVFDINDKQFAAIKSHMFPAGWPKDTYGWVVQMCDKIATYYECTVNPMEKFNNLD